MQLVYVVDFYCASRKLVIELDGDSQNEMNSGSDPDRQCWQEQNGIRVLRFENDDVLEGVGWRAGSDSACLRDG